MPVTEFDDSAHYGLFLTNPNKLDSSTTKRVRMSELTLAALRAAGFLDNMEDGTSPPTIDKLWLDKNFDPAVLKEWNPIGAAWEKVTSETLFGRVPWRGEWDDEPIYRIGDIVSYQGAIWIAVQTSQNHIPAEDAYWDLFIAAIPDGAVTTPKIADQAVTATKLATGLVTFDTEAIFVAANIAASINQVVTAGYYSAGDGGGHRKIRIVTPSPVKAWQKQSADGAWWQVAETLPTPLMFGAKRDATTNDRVAIQAACDYAAGKVVRVPAGQYGLNGTVVVPKGTHVYGDNPDVRNFGGTYADRGTVFLAIGTPVTAVWTDITGADAAISVLIVAGGSGCTFKNFTIGNEQSTWIDAGLFIPGVKRTTVDEVNSYGKVRGGVYIDATWGIDNTTLTALHTEITPDDGPIETRVARCWLQGLWGLRILGTTRDPASYNSTTWIWSPAGASDITVEDCRLNADNDFIDIADRVSTGGGAEISGRTISASTGNRLWRINFHRCHFRSRSKFQHKLDYAHRVSFVSCEGETPDTTGLGGPAVLGLSLNVGDVAFLDDNQIARVEVNGVEVSTQLYSVPIGSTPARYIFVGRDGRILSPNLNLQTATNAPEIHSGQTDGLFKFIQNIAGVMVDALVGSVLSLRPGVNNVTDLGSTSVRWKVGWFGTGIVTQSVTAANIASKAHAVNTTGKQTGMIIRDTTNNRLMIANGTTDVSTWSVCDGSATVTPS